MKPPTAQEVNNLLPVKPKLYRLRVLGAAMIYTASLLIPVLIISSFIFEDPIAAMNELMIKSNGRIIYALIYAPFIFYGIFVMWFYLLMSGNIWLVGNPIHWLIGLKKYAEQLDEFQEIRGKYYKHQKYLKLKKEYEKE